MRAMRWLEPATYVALGGVVALSLTLSLSQSVLVQESATNASIETVSVEALAGVAAVVFGLLLGLVHRSFAAQKAQACEVAKAMAGLQLSASKNTAQLQQDLAALRLHAAHLEATLEAERIRVAQELHDELGSILTALKFELSGVSGGSPQAGRKPQRRRASADLVDSALLSVRHLIATVQPYPLHRAGLWGALAWKAGVFEKSTGIACRVEMPDDLPWPSKEVAMAAFRIVEDGLTHAQHAGATRVEIQVQFAASQLLIEMSCDGDEIPNDGQLVGTAGCGLTGMRERARAVAGTVSFFARAGHGSRLRFLVQDLEARPLVQEEVS